MDEVTGLILQADDQIPVARNPEQRVRIDALDLEVGFAEGEHLRTEISSKFRRAGVVAELAAAGLELVEWWTDPDRDFALSLSVVR